MSPEQMTHAALVDQRTDIWSLGVLLFELLTQSRPFDGSTVPEVCAKVLTAPALPIHRVRPNVDRGLEDVVMRCLEKNPDDRYASVTALAEALQAFASGAGRHVPLAFARTERVVGANRAQRRANTSLGSLAAVAARLNIRRKHHTPAVAATALVVGASIGWFGWTHPAMHPDFAELANVQLPGDPVLYPDPPDVPLERTWAAEQPMVRLDSTILASSDAGRSVERLEPGRLTPMEIERRRENYQNWLRAHGLRRIGDGAGTDDEGPMRSTPPDNDHADERRQEAPE
jgi:hypothetical protein